MSPLIPALMEIQTQICPGGATQADLSHWRFPVHGGFLKVKITLEQASTAQRGEQRYSSTHSLTSALDRVGGQLHALTALPRDRPGTHCIGGWMGPRAENLAPPVFDPRTV